MDCGTCPTHPPYLFAFVFSLGENVVLTCGLSSLVWKKIIRIHYGLGGEYYDAIRALGVKIDFCEEFKCNPLLVLTHVWYVLGYIGSPVFLHINPLSVHV